jgi:predicted adenine nucleotide alpha hydrolase (AANH) superfamily ATPase
MAKSVKKILVHTCCIACASHVFSLLEKAGFSPIAFFYNPMLDDEEYKKRFSDFEKYCLENNVKLIDSRYNHDEFEKQIEPYRDKLSLKYINDKDRYRRRRCHICNSLIIQKTVEKAKEEKIKFFTTTLLASPYKDHDEILEICNEKGLDYRVSVYYEDFRKGYWMGRNYARNHEIYIPRYCGCLESIKEKRLE